MSAAAVAAVAVAAVAAAVAAAAAAAVAAAAVNSVAFQLRYLHTCCCFPSAVRVEARQRQHDPSESVRSSVCQREEVSRFKWR